MTPVDPLYLIFGHRAARYGVEVATVREIVALPALAPVEEMPAAVVGAFNLRGRLVPVMDLGLRFGHPPQPLRLANRVVVVDGGQGPVGVVADELHDVVAIAPLAIDPAGGPGADLGPRLVRGAARLDDGLVMLLDTAALLDGPAPASPAPPPFDQPSSEDLEILNGRARSLARPDVTAQTAGLESFAVIRLDAELFGLSLDVVSEFAHLGRVAPVPCSPPHIAGNMNLRGDILTLVDIRPALGMPTGGAVREVAVLRSGERLIGVPAAEIVDVISLAPADIAGLPAASVADGREYFRGVAALDGQAVGLLDAASLLSAPALQVDETVG